MAILNPSPPNTNDPNYLNWSRSIEQPTFEADKSGAFLGKAIGEGISETATAADTAVKNTINYQVETGVDTLRDAQTAALDSANAAVKNDASLLTQGGEKVPPGLANLDSTLAQLKGAKANGKLSETYYIGQLNSMAKSLRTQYAGYTDYIDQKFAEVTGMNPANQYIKSVLSDLNTFMSQSQEQRNKVGTKLLDAAAQGVDGMGDLYNAWKTGALPDDQAVLRLNRAMSNDWNAKRRIQDNSVQNSDRTTLQNTTEDSANVIASTFLGNKFDNITTLGGVDTNGKLLDFLHKVDTGEISLSSEAATKMASDFQVVSAKAEKELNDKFAQINPATGRSYISDLGVDKVKSIVAGNMQTFNTVTSMLKDQNFSPAFAAMKLSQAKLADGEYGILQNKDISQLLVKMHTANAVAGPNFAGQLLQSVLAKGPASQALSSWLNDEGLDVVNQPDGNKTSTIKAAIDKAQTFGVKDPKVYDVLTSLPGMIADKTGNISDQGKLNIAKGAFDPAGYNLISKFGDDQKYDIYRRFTSPDIAGELYRLSKTDAKDGPKVWNNYKMWVEKTFGSELFPQEMQNLNGYSKSDNGFVIPYDNDSNKFGPLRVTTGAATIGQRDPVVAQAIQRNLDRINSGIAPLVNIAKIEGTDPNAMIWEYLQNSGVEGSFGEGLQDAIKNSRPIQGKQRTLKDLIK